jgi:hypothetical protein
LTFKRELGLCFWPQSLHSTSEFTLDIKYSSFPQWLSGQAPQKSFTLGLSVEIPNVLLAKTLIITGLKDYVWSQKITKIWLVDELASAQLERRVRSP